MTMAEKQMMSIEKEIEKLQKSIDRNEGRLEKKTALCEKLGCNWSDEEWYQHREARDFSQEQWIAWFDKGVVETELEDLYHRIENSQKRLSKKALEVEGIKTDEQETAEINKKESSLIDWYSLSLEERKAKYEAWLKAFKAECLKDGVIIDEASNYSIWGTAKNGKRFYMGINDGWTKRSLHCYCLKIDGNLIFTSGNFETAYRIIKR